MPPDQRKTKQNNGRLRIIGGHYRGRRLPVPSQPGLRPTPNRVRETLFNWLQPVIEGARCLDLFAGSGALGFEAASRGAAEIVMIERSEPVVRALQDNVRSLGSAQVRVYREDALCWLSKGGEPFDIVFLDPPFDAGQLGRSCALLSNRGWVASGALVYMEGPADQEFPSLPPGWTSIKDKRAGQVRFALAAVESQDAPVA